MTKKYIFWLQTADKVIKTVISPTKDIYEVNILVEGSYISSDRRHIFSGGKAQITGGAVIPIFSDWRPISRESSN